MLLKSAGLLLLITGALAILAFTVSLWGIDHNSFYTCDAEPRPPGSLPYEAGYAGDGTVVFPVTGVRCDWNAVDGGTFSTIIPSITATVIGWAAVLLPVAGVTLLVIRAVRDASAA